MRTDLQAALIDAYRVTDKRIREWLAFNHQPARSAPPKCDPIISTFLQIF